MTTTFTGRTRAETKRKALTFWVDNREKLDLMAAALIKYETIDEEQLKDIMAGRVPKPPRDWDETGTQASGQADAKPEPVIGPPASQT